jgi:mannose-6-phosphate isomerase-like protein (cupin superfamily)/pyrimidine operon attenuation protein/uracil phosphoribosyltransferase
VVVLASDLWEPKPNQSRADNLLRNPDLWNRSPTAAETYLAELAAQEFIGPIIQLGVANSLEQALGNRLPPGQYMRLVRDQHSDEFLEKALHFEKPRVKLLKLRGDLIGDSTPRIHPDANLSPKLRKSLRLLVQDADLLWIGPIPSGRDVDAVLSAAHPDYSLWWVTEQPSSEELLRRLSDNCDRWVIQAGTGFDECIRDLALQTFRAALKPIERQSIRRLNEQIRAKLPVDVTYADQLIQQLAQQIRIACDGFRRHTLLTYIHDPAAPGGSEVQRRISRYLKTPDGREPESIQITVRGTDVRWIDRRALPLELPATEADYAKIVIVDSISFTGRTLQIATEHIRQTCPTADIYWAVLIAFQKLADELSATGMPKDHLIAAATTDRHDIFFPWGWTQATSPIVRAFDFIDRSQEVSVDPRPWGTVEVIAEQMPCTVRLLSVRAGHRLSYHSHSARDKLFIVVTGDVGFEFDSDVGGVVDAILLSEGEYISVPRGVRHRFAAYRDTGRILEISFGLYDADYDIEQFSDDYGRIGKPGDD